MDAALSARTSSPIARSSLLDSYSPVANVDGDESNLELAPTRTGIVGLLLEI